MPEVPLLQRLPRTGTAVANQMAASSRPAQHRGSRRGLGDGLPERPGHPVGWGEDATLLADFTSSPLHRPVRPDLGPHYTSQVMTKERMAAIRAKAKREGYYVGLDDAPPSP
jgi:hypothetical protein